MGLEDGARAAARRPADRRPPVARRARCRCDFVGKALLSAVDARGRTHARPHAQLPLQHLDPERQAVRTRPGRIEHGLSSSVMDYATPNIAADHSQQGEYYCDHGRAHATCGTIRYGYTPTGADRRRTPTTRTCRRSRTSPRSPGTSTRPTRTPTRPTRSIRARTSGISATIRCCSRRSARRTSSLWQNPKFEERILGATGEYPMLRRAMDGLLVQYADPLGLAVKYVGGQYQSRDHRGQPDARRSARRRCRRRGSARRSTSWLGARVRAGSRSRCRRACSTGSAQDRFDALGHREWLRVRRPPARLRLQRQRVRDPDRALERAHGAAT